MKRLIALAAFLAATCSVAQADTGYFLYETYYSPYQKILVGGPYPDYQTCARIMALEPYQQGAGFTCEVRAY